MPYDFLDIAATDSVKRVQAAMGADHIWRSPRINRPSHRFTADEAGFIAARDSFYMATVSETGWPYMQHRGGPPGFLKVLDETTLAFADYSGNRQYLSTGNIAADGRAMLFLMDYAHRARLKIFVHAEVVSPEADPALLAAVTDAGYRARIERIMRLRLEAFDWNCPQHITPRLSADELAEVALPLRERVAALESENALLRARLSQTRT